ncbi:chloride channel protein [Novosphingobium sp.]|uniref:chloride channel protein n=1 Tax=Novosphingobium sp. TaxID=1874826 RepID=UPI003BA8BD88
MAALLGATLLSLVAIAFAAAGEQVQRAFHLLVGAVWWSPLIVTPLTFAGVVGLTRAQWPEAKGSGIPQVMAAGRAPEAASSVRLIALPVAAAKFVFTLVMLLAGAPAGREGPTVQISAAIMAGVHRWMRVPVTSGVVIAGGAAGVAAAFNTPLAGVAFAIEELASAFEQRVAALVMVTVMVSGLISLGVAGDYVYFGAMSQQLPLRAMLIAAPLAGVFGGVCGGLFSKVLIAMSWSRRRLFVAIRARPVGWAFACGLAVAVIGIATGGLTWGTGYDATRRLLGGEAYPLLFGPARFVATLATAISGAPGGIFAPTLSVGAGLGQLLAVVFPRDEAGAIVLLGLIGYFAGVVRAPLTAVIIVSEMTADRSMILPLFATALIADQVSGMVCPQKLYHALARQFAPPRRERG